MASTEATNAREATGSALGYGAAVTATAGTEAAARAAGTLAQVDPEVSNAIVGEATRLRETIQLIPSENYPSLAVMEATGSVLTTKYAEGYPEFRYYQGCTWVNVVEDLARKRACALFGADHANVQPHSGSSANMGVYFAALQLGDTVMGMELNAGGHLTHGSPVNFSSKLYHFVTYGVAPQTERIDYDQVAALAKEHHPKMIVVGSSAYPRIFDWTRFREIADSVGALLLADMAHISGLVAGGAHPSPVPYADYASTSTHKTLRGPRGGMVLCRQQYAEALDKAIMPGMQGGPLEHVIAAKAVMLHEAAQPDFRDYAHAVVDNAKVLADTLLSERLTLVSGGTDNHLLLVRLPVDGPSGRQTAQALERAGLVVNANTVPGETKGPVRTSGIRLGTPATTTFGFGPDEFREIGHMVAAVVRDIRNRTLLSQTATRVKELCATVEARRRAREATRQHPAHVPVMA
ncbi:MAG: serine hydroxymethyltransferase [Chloroflexi bacterium]|nr:serine hydroxymethyltransferase [Chloroflexota bacterium]